MAISTVIFGALTTIMGTYFQNRNHKIESVRAYRDYLLPKASDARSKVISSMELLIYYSDEVLWGLVLRNFRTGEKLDPSNADDHEAWEKYQEALTVWRKNITEHYCQVEECFGMDVLETLESVCQNLDKMEKHIKATYYNRETSKYYLKEECSSNQCYRKNDSNKKSYKLKKIDNTVKNECYDKGCYKGRYFELKEEAEEKIKTVNSAMTVKLIELSKGQFQPTLSAPKFPGFTLSK